MLRSAGKRRILKGGIGVVKIRQYRNKDAESVGRLIADTYSKFNLSFVPPGQRSLFLGPFHHARSNQEPHKEVIARTIRAVMVFVAEDEGEIVGVLRGSTGRLHSLFVASAYHGQGIGQRLVARFERACLGQGATAITLASSLYAVPFYAKLGYKKSTGVRSGPCFDGQGFPYQPMKKVLGNCT